MNCIKDNNDDDEGDAGKKKNKKRGGVGVPRKKNLAGINIT